jgi:carbon-monoxide dehydrogenase medium subunit
MKAPDFLYRRAHTLEEAFDLLDEYGDEARLLAGGQTLLATLNMRLSAPRVLIDLAPLRVMLGDIRFDGDYLSIGALATHHEIMASQLVARHLPLLAQAVPYVAHEAIRNRGTFGGSIALADPAAEYPACALALKATFVIAGRNGTRRVAADDFFLGLYTTAMQQGEILLAAEFCVCTPNTRCSFMELARRHGDYAIIGVAIQAELEAGRMSQVRIAFLSAGDTPCLARHASAALENQLLDASAIQHAQALLGADLAPPADLTTSSATKLHLARVLTGRALNQMAQAA